jgi:hypothetical protein
MRMLLMPLIRPIEMKAPLHAANASASSERGCPGRRIGCRINRHPQRRHRPDVIAVPSNASYQQLQLSSQINHKKIANLKQ